MPRCYNCVAAPVKSDLLRDVLLFLASGFLPLHLPRVSLILFFLLPSECVCVYVCNMASCSVNRNAETDGWILVYVHQSAPFIGFQLKLAFFPKQISSKRHSFLFPTCSLTRNLRLFRVYLRYCRDSDRFFPTFRPAHANDIKGRFDSS